MDGLQFLMEEFANADPEQLLQDAMRVEDDAETVPQAADILGAGEEAQENALAHQVRDVGVAPLEANGDMDEATLENAVDGPHDNGEDEEVDDEMDDEVDEEVEDESDGGIDREGDESAPDDEDSDFDDTSGLAQAPPKRAQRKKSSRSQIRTGNSASQPKNEALQTAISAKARLPSCEIGAVELLTFFPNHTQWPEAGMRLYRNGWRNPEIARVQLDARGELTRKAYGTRCNTLKKQVGKNGNEIFNLPDFALKRYPDLLTPVTSYDASNYEPLDNLKSFLFDARLLDVAQGVLSWPTGADRGIVAQAIEYAQQNNDAQLTTTNIPQIAQQQSFVLPAEATGGQWDQNAKGRIDQIAGQVP